MAANYWESTQRKHWQFSKPELARLRQKLEDEDKNLVQTYPLPPLRHLSIFFNQRECPLRDIEIHGNNNMCFRG
jgi:cyclin C